MEDGTVLRAHDMNKRISCGFVAQNELQNNIRISRTGIDVVILRL